MDSINTDWTALFLYQILSRPKKHPLKAHETEVLNKAIPQDLFYNGKRISGYFWGQEGHPKVLMVHGWEGRAGNFGAIVEVLLALDYCVFAFDGPAHGRSEKGATSMFSYARFVNERIKEINPKIIITHSFGSVPTLMALSELEQLAVEQIFSLTTPYDFKHFLDRTMKRIGISAESKKKLIRLIEKRDGVDITTLNMDARAHLLKVNPKITIVHSKDDQVLPISESILAEKALPNAKLLPLKGLGHYSILWAEETLKIIKKAI